MSFGKKHRRRGGFTLLEVLVAVAIIAVLMICVVTAARPARAFAMRGVCTARIHNLAMAMLLYAQDNGQTLPASPVPGYHRPQGIWFQYATLVSPYMGLSEARAEQSPSVFSCPLSKGSVDHPNYLFNSGNQFDSSFPGIAGDRIVQIEGASRTLLLFELSAVFAQSWHQPQSSKISSFNNARSIVAFVDGHAAFIPIYWSGKSLAVGSNPPPGYDYKLSAQ